LVFQFTLEVDKNANFPNLPVILERKAYFGQVRKFIALTVPPNFPPDVMPGRRNALTLPEKEPLFSRPFQTPT
jgi:hypothetical protein